MFVSFWPRGFEGCVFFFLLPCVSFVCAFLPFFSSQLIRDRRVQCWIFQCAVCPAISLEMPCRSSLANQAEAAQPIQPKPDAVSQWGPERTCETHTSTHACTVYCKWWGQIVLQRCTLTHVQYTPDVWCNAHFRKGTLVVEQNIAAELAGLWWPPLRFDGAI